MRIIQSFVELVGMKHTEKHCPSALNMVIRSVFTDVYHKQSTITLLKHTMEEHIHPVSPLGNFIIVYLNGQNKIEEFGVKLKFHMYSEDHVHNLDLVCVVGNMTREEKTNYISKLLS